MAGRQNAEVMKAAFAGDENQLLAAIAAVGPAFDPNAVDSGKRTALYSACRGESCSPDKVMILADRGADVQKPSGDYKSLPQHACVQLWGELAQKGKATQAMAGRIAQTLNALRHRGANFATTNAHSMTAIEEMAFIPDNQYTDIIRQVLTVTPTAPSISPPKSAGPVASSRMSASSDPRSGHPSLSQQSSTSSLGLSATFATPAPPATPPPAAAPLPAAGTPYSPYAYSPYAQPAGVHGGAGPAAAAAPMYAPAATAAPAAPAPKYTPAPAAAAPPTYTPAPAAAAAAAAHSTPANSAIDEATRAAQKAIYKAAFDGNHDALQAVLQQHPTLDLDRKPPGEQNTLIYTACRGRNCNPDIVLHLLKLGASLLETSRNGSLPQHGIVAAYIEFMPKMADPTARKEFADRLVAILRTLHVFRAGFGRGNGAGHTAYAELTLYTNKKQVPYMKELAQAMQILSFRIHAIAGPPHPDESLLFQNFRKKLAETSELSEPLSYNLSQEFWKADSDDIMIPTVGTELDDLCKGVNLSTFFPATLEVWVCMRECEKLWLRVPRWPSDCSLYGGGQMFVTWQYMKLLDDGWIDCDQQLADQLNSKATDLSLGTAKYQLDESNFVLRGDGAFNGALLRWVPRADAPGSDDEQDVEDDMHDEARRRAIFENSKTAIDVPDAMLNAHVPAPAQPHPPTAALMIDPSAPQLPAVDPALKTRAMQAVHALSAIQPPAYGDTRKPQSIEVDEIPEKLIGDSPFKLCAWASSGLPVMFTSMNPSIAIVSGRQVTLLGDGETSIVASQSGNGEYRPAESINMPLRVTTIRKGRFALPDSLLSPAYMQLATKLPHVLKARSIEDIRWERGSTADQAKMVFCGTDVQLALLRHIVTSVETINSHIEHHRQLLKSNVAAAMCKLGESLRDNGVRLQDGDPVRVMCREYFKRLTAALDAKKSSVATNFENAIKKAAPDYIDIVLTGVEETDRAKKNDCIQRAVEGIITRIASERQQHLASLDLEGTAFTTLVAYVKEIETLDKDGQIFKPEFPLKPGQYERFCGFRDMLLADAQKKSPKFSLPTVLRDFSVHRALFQRNLDFYTGAAVELMAKVKANDVVIVNTSTGSGKSTMMPLLLLASGDGYERIAVTQPRRFAAESVQDNISKHHGPVISGFRMSGRSHNAFAPIVYITDGLLRTMLGLRGTDLYDVIIIDEVHERSAEIDACIALLAHAKATGFPIPKVILSSATLDESVLAPFREAKAKIATLSSKVTNPHRRTRHFVDGPAASKEPDVCQLASCHICHAIKTSLMPLDAVTRLSRLLHGSEQLLCFVASTVEVTTMIKQLGDMNIHATALYSQQKGNEQVAALASGRIFISTNIAETSLTFKNLRYVIDCGTVQRPRSANTASAVMETVPASLSTLAQRFGRVGRTRDGDYVALYTYKSITERKPHIDPKMVLEQHEDLLYSLQCQLKETCTLRFPIGNFSLPKLDDMYFRFPVLGSKKMADAFFAAQRWLQCGDEILLFAALRMKFQPKMLQVLASAAQKLTPDAGDITVLVSMLRMLDAALPPHRPFTEKDVNTWCNQTGLTEYAKPLYRAVHEYRKMKEYYAPKVPPQPHNASHQIFAHVQKRSFDDLGKTWNGFVYGRKNPDGSPDMKCAENYETTRLQKGGSFNPALVIQALAFGFKTIDDRAGNVFRPSNIFVHLNKLDGPINNYSRMADMGDGGDSDTDPMRTMFSLHSKSVLAKAKPKPEVIVAIDTMLFGDEMPLQDQPFRLGVLSLVEAVDLAKFDPSLPLLMTKRRVALHSSDPAANKTTFKGRSYAIIEGPVSEVVRKEIALRKDLRVEEQVKLLGVCDPLLKDMVTANMETFREDKQVFQPMKYFWCNQYGVELEIHLIADPYIKITGRRADIERFKKHIAYWTQQLNASPRVEAPDQFMSADLYRRPRQLEKGDEEFRERLHNVTAITLTDSKLFQLTRGPNATRETRMEVVARIAIQTFNCRVVGGFIRDWIVRGQKTHPSKAFPDWIHKPGGYITYDILDDVTPKDLDIELPMDTYFDVNRFVSEVRTHGIHVDFHEHVAQRHIFLFERERGPFTADFIEPHFSVLHSRADFNVNIMCLVKYPDLIGLKAPYKPTGGPPITVDDVIADCLKFQLLPLQLANRTIDLRIDKMRKRGWTILPTVSIVPINPKLDFTIVEVPKTHPFFTKYATLLNGMKRGAGKLLSMYEIRSSLVDGHYSAMKAEFEKVNGAGGANELELFHGTKDNAIQPILKGGFDDHFWKSTGYFGRGAYFADDPSLSAGFTEQTNPRTIFVCSVLLGRQQDLSATPLTKAKGADFFPDHGYNSVKGCIQYNNSNKIREMEYIVYRYGQAKPLYMLRFDM
eukprot:m.12416 g.12416  ORF g.12416 m.12416 type:complete len:2363 (-) comp2729_c0_seq1:86-7174(-)